jgi:hypothetical protein
MPEHPWQTEDCFVSPLHRPIHRPRQHLNRERLLRQRGRGTQGLRCLQRLRRSACSVPELGAISLRPVSA